MRQHAFARDERLIKSKDFASVRKDGKRVTGRNLIIFYKPNGLGIRRLGLAVSTKVGGAVKRNRIKRFLRESFRLNKELFPASADVFISVRQGFSPCRYREVEAEVRSILKGRNGV